MTDFAETGKKLTEICPTVISLTTPLIQATPVKHFGYIEMRSDGTYYGINSTPEIFKEFVASGIYENAPAYHAHTVKTRGMHVADLIPEQKRLWGIGNKIMEVHKSFGYGHVCAYVRTLQEGGVKKYLSFHFWGDAGDDSINQFYVNNTNLIKYFSRYFHREIQPLLKKIPPYRTEADVGAFINGLGRSEVPIPKLLLAFSERTHLSQRQVDIFTCYLKGKTADETAEQLGISVATVKTHVQRMREKLGCRTKAEMAVKLLGDGLFLPD